MLKIKHLKKIYLLEGLILLISVFASFFTQWWFALLQIALFVIWVLIGVIGNRSWFNS